MDNNLSDGMLGKIAAGMGRDLAYLSPAQLARAYEDEWLAKYAELSMMIALTGDPTLIDRFKDLVKMLTPAIAAYSVTVERGLIKAPQPPAPSPREWLAFSDESGASSGAGEEPERFDEATGPMGGGR